MFALRIDGDIYGPYETRAEAVADLPYFVQKRRRFSRTTGPLTGNFEICEMLLTQEGEKLAQLKREEDQRKWEQKRAREILAAKDGAIKGENVEAPNIATATDLGTVITQTDTSEPAVKGETE